MHAKFIKKIHFHNFRAFRDRRIENLNEGVNILIGDNGTGKSSILLAIDLTLGANTNRIENIGLDRLFNQQAIADFMANEEKRNFDNLPTMEVDIYLNELGEYLLEGEQNLSHENCCGLHLLCKPKNDLAIEINELLSLEQPVFPFEYYSIEIKSFGGAVTTRYNKPLNHVNIDNTKISYEYASKSYIQSLYRANVDDIKKSELQYEYRRVKENFANEEFATINDDMEGDFGFSIKSSSKTNIETDLTIAKEGVDIDNLGVGEQCFVRTQFALSRNSHVDIVLLEEPENHLSHPNMKRLIDQISAHTQSQIFIATHSSLVCSSLDLRRAVVLGSVDKDPLYLKDLPSDTAEFFIKAPNSFALEFVLAPKNILVEGNAEYILFDTFYQNITGDELSGSGIGLIAIGGTSFPRYLDIAKVIGTKTAVVTDNDGNIQGSINDRYDEYQEIENLEVFYDLDEARRTLEICVYQDNTKLCEELFKGSRKSLLVQDYMLKNKSKVALELVKHKPDEIAVPRYIDEAIEWIKN